MANKLIQEVVDKQYPYGFETNIESDTFAAGLSEEVIRKISARKNEPAFMLAFRLKAYEYWRTLTPPEWRMCTTILSIIKTLFITPRRSR